MIRRSLSEGGSGGEIQNQEVARWRVEFEHGVRCTLGVGAKGELRMAGGV